MLSILYVNFYLILLLIVQLSVISKANTKPQVIHLRYTRFFFFANEERVKSQCDVYPMIRIPSTVLKNSNCFFPLFYFMGKTMSKKKKGKRYIVSAEI